LLVRGERSPVPESRPETSQLGGVDTAVSRVGSAVKECQEILEASLPLSTLSVPVYPAYSLVGSQELWLFLDTTKVKAAARLDAPAEEYGFLSDHVPDAPAEEVAAVRLGCPGGRVRRQWSVVSIKQVVWAVLQFVRCYASLGCPCGRRV
jgi:hypothetical protein